MIVNKSYPLDSTYKPVNPYKPITSDYIYGEDYLEKEVMEAFIKMKTEAQKLGYSLKRGFKHFALWGVSLFYKLGIPMVYIKIYRFLVDKLKIDIKF